MAWRIEGVDDPPAPLPASLGRDWMLPIRSIGSMLTGGRASDQVELLVGGLVVAWVLYRLGRARR